jgi:predicted nuclease with TOPRIM domain
MKCLTCGMEEQEIARLNEELKIVTKKNDELRKALTGLFAIVEEHGDRRILGHAKEMLGYRSALTEGIDNTWRVDW